MKIRFQFENRPAGNGTDRTYVGVLADSEWTKGPIASQNAGSSLPGIYYEVGGGGVNGAFAGALGSSLQAEINRRLAAMYDRRYGPNAWQQDRRAGVTDRLTSFLVPFDPGKAADAGTSCIAMIYSVGPQLDSDGITDEPQYRGVYRDAFAAVATANESAAPAAHIDAVRITMVSTGIFGGGDPVILAATAARLIVDGLVEAASTANATDLPTTILVNSAIRGGRSKEIDAFTALADARDYDVSTGGFDVRIGG